MNNNTNSKNNILQCALRLFGKRGYESVGIAEITQQADITKPVLYYFFKARREVFKVILEEYYKRFNYLLQTVCIYIPPAESYKEDVFKVVEMYFSFA